MEKDDACGIDTTLISMDVKEGWRISEYIESKPLDHENKSDVMAAISTIRKLHENKPKACRKERLSVLIAVPRWLIRRTVRNVKKFCQWSVTDSFRLTLLKECAGVVK